MARVHAPPPFDERQFERERVGSRLQTKVARDTRLLSVACNKRQFTVFCLDAGLLPRRSALSSCVRVVDTNAAAIILDGGAPAVARDSLPLARAHAGMSALELSTVGGGDGGDPTERGRKRSSRARDRSLAH